VTQLMCQTCASNVTYDRPCDDQTANDIHKSGERGGSTESERVEEEASDRRVAVWVF
jgi:hypothetical protein